MTVLGEDILRVLVSQEELAETIQRLGREITEDYAGEEILVVGLLRGAAIFMADIIRAIDCYLEIDFMDVSSYGDASESSGNVRILKDLDTDVKGRHVLIVEDIVDTGRTIKTVMEILEARQAASVKVCSLLDKPSRREFKTIKVDYTGIEIPNEFVVGYGLDFKQKYRNFPYIGVLKPEVYE